MRPEDSPAINGQEDRGPKEHRRPNPSAQLPSEQQPVVKQLSWTR